MVGVTSRNLQTQKTELLTREEEYDLILRARAGEEAAKTRLIRKNKGLIKKAIKRYCPQVDWRVLTTAGELAVITAIKKFDLSTGNRFSTYLVPTIRSEVRDCFCSETGISRNTLENLGKISNASAALRQKLGRDPTLEEIVERSELSQRQILNAWENKTFAQPLSFNQRYDDNCPEWLDSQVDPTVDEWRTTEDTEILDALDQLEHDGQLEDRQVSILIAKHQGYNNREVGEHLGVSRERVRQLFNKAKQTLSAFATETLKPQPIKTTIPIPTHQNTESIGKGDQLSLDLPVPEKVRKPAVKRVDASRLGGRIGNAIKQIFSQTKEYFVDGFGEVTHAQKHLLVFRRRSSHRTTDRSGYQFASTDQRCRRLGQIRDAWRGHLGLGQEKFQQPLASAFHHIRGFSSKLNRGRENIQFSLASVFEPFVIGQGSSPTDHRDKFSIETNYISSGGIDVNLALTQATAWIFDLWCSFVILFRGFSTDNWSHAPELLRPLSTQYSQKYQQFSSVEDNSDLSVALEKYHQKEFLLRTLELSRAVETCVASALGGLSMGLFILLGLDLILPTEEPAT